MPPASTVTLARGAQLADHRLEVLGPAPSTQDVAAGHARPPQ